MDLFLAFAFFDIIETIKATTAISPTAIARIAITSPVSARLPALISVAFSAKASFGVPKAKQMPSARATLKAWARLTPETLFW